MKGRGCESSQKIQTRLSKGKREYHVPASQGTLWGDEKVKTRRQLVAGISRWYASLPEMEQRSETKTPSWREDSLPGPSAGVLGQAGKRSLSPSARKWDGGGGVAFCSFHLQDGREAKTDGWRVSRILLSVKVRKGACCSRSPQVVLQEMWEWK